MSIFASMLDWTTRVFTPLGLWGLFILAFIESSFFPIPPDILIIILTLDNPSLWFVFALVATIGSTVGGFFGYGIGYVGEEAILKRFISKKKIDKVHKLYSRYEAWAVFIGGFTPLPYKVFSISAGVFYIDLKKFMIATVLSRGLRFTIVALLVSLFGQPIVTFINTYFNILTLVAVVAAILGYIIYKRYKKNGYRHKK